MKRRQDGVTLIEVMISTVVVSVGLLGVFQLHLVAKRSSYESFQYTQAHALATDIVERMRVNASQVAAYVSRDYGMGVFVPPARTCASFDFDHSLCAPAEIRQWDLYRGEEMLVGRDEQIDDRNVGSANAMRGCITAANGEVEVVVSWRGMDETTDGALGGTAALCGVSDARRRSVRIATRIVDSI